MRKHLQQHYLVLLTSSKCSTLLKKTHDFLKRDIILCEIRFPVIKFVIVDNKEGDGIIFTRGALLECLSGCLLVCLFLLLCDRYSPTLTKTYGVYLESWVRRGHGHFLFLLKNFRQTRIYK